MATGVPKTKWNGKLPKSALTARAYRLAVEYEGKATEEEILATAPVIINEISAKTSKENSIKRLYYGDNLPILAALLQDKRIKGKVTLIYIDPPYGTNSVFHSRAQEDAYSDLLVGSSYAEFLRRRLVLMRELLSEDGSIYVHLDSNMLFVVKLLMDEIFGEQNFRNLITRKKCNPKNYTRKTYGNVSDYLLFYTKSDNYIWNRALAAWDDEKIKKEYNYIDPKTGRRYKKVPLHAPGIRNGETGKPWREKLPPPGKHWQYPPTTLDAMDKRGEIYWSPNNNPRRKVYFDENGGIPIQDIWLDYKDAHNQNIHITGYPTEKNLEMLKLIIEASSNEDDIVLDCFAGSGTALVAADMLKRNWIGIDNSPHAIKTIVERFQVGTKPMGDYVTAKTAQKKADQVELSLFNNAAEKNGRLTKFGSNHAESINDYTLLVTKELQDELSRNLSI